jgi:hypothetical protein
MTELARTALPASHDGRDAKTTPDFRRREAEQARLCREWLRSLGEGPAEAALVGS